MDEARDSWRIRSRLGCGLGCSGEGNLKDSGAAFAADAVTEIARLKVIRNPTTRTDNP